MKVVYTASAVQDLSDIADWLHTNYPAIAPAVARRIRAVVVRIGRWPDSAPRSNKRADVRVAAVGRYPYKIFYRVRDNIVEILHIHHAAREPWDERD
jgi:plasmid stabilization system protein ParE